MLKKPRGKIFEVYLNGTVIDIKSRKEVGYVYEDTISELLEEECCGTYLDRIIAMRVVFPAFIKKEIKEKVEKIRIMLNKSYRETDIDKYKEHLSDIQFIVLKDIESKKSYREIAEKTGYSVNYLYEVKSKALKKIHEIQKNSA